MIKVFAKIKAFSEEYLFNRKWKCLSCGEEIFEGDFCKECKEKLPVISGATCEHCGRKTDVPEKYCLTCKGNIVSVDKGASVFTYDEPISSLIKKMKYKNARYIAKTFAEHLAKKYIDCGFEADLIVYVPMTEREKKKRGFNQSELLAKGTASLIGLSVSDAVVKIRETEEQAKLTRDKRLKNLAAAFHVRQRKAVKGKRVLIIDDVTTTGATGEAMAQKLKRAGASFVYLLTVASVYLAKRRDGKV